MSLPTKSPVSIADKVSGNNRDKIIEAVLRVVARDGMRGVRHRSVAQEAGVPLGSTTYHFKSIDDLISSAFEYWCHKADKIREPFANERDAILNKYQNNVNYLLEQAVNDLYISGKTYLLDQVISGKEDRIIELAFYHEALHCEKLRQLIELSMTSELERLTHLHSVLGSSNPNADAELTLAVFQQIERFAAVEESSEASMKRVDTVLKHYFSMVFSVSVV